MSELNGKEKSTCVVGAGIVWESGHTFTGRAYKWPGRGNDYMVFENF